MWKDIVEDLELLFGIFYLYNTNSLDNSYYDLKLGMIIMN